MDAFVDGLTFWGCELVSMLATLLRVCSGVQHPATAHLPALVKGTGSLAALFGTEGKVAALVNRVTHAREDAV